MVSRRSSIRPSWTATSESPMAIPRSALPNCGPCPFLPNADIRSIGIEVQATLDSGSGLSELDALVACTLDLSPELRC